MDNKVGVLEGLLFVVGDDGLTFEQISDALDVDLDSAIKKYTDAMNIAKECSSKLEKFL